MSTCINNGNISILFDENGISITNTASRVIQLNKNPFDLLSKMIMSNGKCWWKTKRNKVLCFYNEFIRNGELIRMVNCVLSSSVSTQNILQQLENNQGLKRLERFMELINFISTFHKDENAFLDKWKNISDFITKMRKFNDIHHSSVDLRPLKEETYIQENHCSGKIVFIYSDSTFSFKQQQDKFIGIGITCKSCNNSPSLTSIHVFGSSLVQVVYPTNDYVDERGMFVILNKNQEENIGIGEIIAFGDLITREANSYQIVGICSLDKKELFLCQTSSITSRILGYHSNHSDNCFVLMISLPMSDSLVHLFLQSTLWHTITKKKSSLLL